jgi:hypothetical protein
MQCDIATIMAIRFGISTYRLGSVKHADAEVPQTKTSILTNTAESIIPFVASPRIKSNSRYPRLMTLASGYQCRLGE